MALFLLPRVRPKGSDKTWLGGKLNNNRIPLRPNIRCNLHYMLGRQLAPKSLLLFYSEFFLPDYCLLEQQSNRSSTLPDSVCNSQKTVNKNFEKVVAPQCKELFVLTVARFCYVFLCYMQGPAWAAGRCSISQLACGTF